MRNCLIFAMLFATFYVLANATGLDLRASNCSNCCMCPTNLVDKRWKFTQPSDYSSAQLSAIPASLSGVQAWQANDARRVPVRNL